MFAALLTGTRKYHCIRFSCFAKISKKSFLLFPEDAHEPAISKQMIHILVCVRIRDQHSSLHLKFAHTTASQKRSPTDVCHQTEWVWWSYSTLSMSLTMPVLMLKTPSLGGNCRIPKKKLGHADWFGPKSCMVKVGGRVETEILGSVLRNVEYQLSKTGG